MQQRVRRATTTPAFLGTVHESEAEQAEAEVPQPQSQPQSEKKANSSAKPESKGHAEEAAGREDTGPVPESGEAEL